MGCEHEQHSPSPRSSPSKWIRSKSSKDSKAQDLPDEISIKGKFATFFSKIGAKASRRYNNTAVFRYDPTSYALNFDDGSSHPSFSERLPTAAFSTQIAACS